MSALKLSGAEIRQAFLDFYSQRGHQLLPSGSLVPEDPTVLLTIAGMLPFFACDDFPEMYPYQ
jgi:alanyl-tRNA synthetase